MAFESFSFTNNYFFKSTIRKIIWCHKSRFLERTFVMVLRIFERSFTSGNPTYNSLSNLPGRRIAASRISIGKNVAVCDHSENNIFSLDKLVSTTHWKILDAY